MQEFVKEIEMPLSYRERLDALKVGEFIELEDEKEKEKFNTTMYRDFHRKKPRLKTFTIRDLGTQGKKGIWRLK